jgi:hypothetical protein
VAPRGSRRCGGGGSSGGAFLSALFDPPLAFGLCIGELLSPLRRPQVAEYLGIRVPSKIAGPLQMASSRHLNMCLAGSEFTTMTPQNEFSPYLRATSGQIFQQNLVGVRA